MSRVRRYGRYDWLVLVPVPRPPWVREVQGLVPVYDMRPARRRVNAARVVCGGDRRSLARSPPGQRRGWAGNSFVPYVGGVKMMSNAIRTAMLALACVLPAGRTMRGSRRGTPGAPTRPWPNGGRRRTQGTGRRLPQELPALHTAMEASSKPSPAASIASRRFSSSASRNVTSRASSNAPSCVPGNSRREPPPPSRSTRSRTVSSRR